jgi:hypothetical protein
MSRSSDPETPSIIDNRMLSPRQITTTISHANKMVDEGVMTSEISGVYRQNTGETHRLADVTA